MWHIYLKGCLIHGRMPRAFVALGSIRVDVIDPAILTNLCKLQDLYAQEPSVQTSAASSSHNIQWPPWKQPHLDDPPSDNNDNQAAPPEMEQAGHLGDGCCPQGLDWSPSCGDEMCPVAVNAATEATYISIPVPEFQNKWVLGPPPPPATTPTPTRRYGGSSQERRSYGTPNTAGNTLCWLPTKPRRWKIQVRIFGAFSGSIVVCHISQLRSLVESARFSPALASLFMDNCPSIPFRWMQWPLRSSKSVASTSTQMEADHYYNDTSGENNGVMSALKAFYTPGLYLNWKLYFRRTCRYANLFISQDIHFYALYPTLKVKIQGQGRSSHPGTFGIQDIISLHIPKMWR